MLKLKRFAAIVSCLILVFVVFATPIAAAEDGTITVTFDGTKLEFDVPPQIINGRTMVPMRMIFEALGATVYWNGHTQTVTGTKDETIVTMQINSPIMLVNDREIEIDAPPVLIDDRTLVPVRAIAESLGMDVDWIDEAQVVIISSLPFDAVPVGIAYMNTDLGMATIINNVDWRFFTGASDQAFSGQVFFYNHVVPSDINLISISAQPMSHDFAQTANYLWFRMRQSHALWPHAETIVYHEMQTITVGNAGYLGFVHTFESIYDGETWLHNALFWGAGGMIYICTVSSDQDGADEVQAVLNGILDSFISLKLLNQ